MKGQTPAQSRAARMTNTAGQLSNLKPINNPPKLKSIKKKQPIVRNEQSRVEVYVRDPIPHSCKELRAILCAIIPGSNCLTSFDSIFHVSLY